MLFKDTLRTWRTKSYSHMTTTKKKTEIHKKHRSNTVTLTENREIKKGVQKLPDFVVS